MAFDLSKFGRLSGDANSDLPVLYGYASADAIADVNTAGYFNEVSNILTVRDIIFVVDTNTPTTHIVSVLSNTGGVVDVSDGLAITETDTD